MVDRRKLGNRRTPEERRALADEIHHLVKYGKDGIRLKLWQIGQEVGLTANQVSQYKNGYTCEEAFIAAYGHPRRQKVPTLVLTDKDVHQICQRVLEVMAERDISERQAGLIVIAERRQYTASAEADERLSNAIQGVLDGTSFNRIGILYLEEPKRFKAQLESQPAHKGAIKPPKRRIDVIAEIWYWYDAGLSRKQIANKMFKQGISYDTVCNVLKGKSYLGYSQTLGRLQE